MLLALLSVLGTATAQPCACQPRTLQFTFDPSLDCSQNSALPGGAVVLRCDDAPIVRVTRVSFLEFDSTYTLLGEAQVFDGENLQSVDLASITSQAAAPSLPQYWETYISGLDQNGNLRQALWAVRLNLFECDYQPWRTESIGIMRLVRKRTFGKKYH